MWIQLLALWTGDTDGIVRAHYPGEWIDLGKQPALKLIGEGRARPARPVNLEVAAGCGVVLTGRSTEQARMLISKVKSLPTKSGEPELAFERTLILDGALLLPLELIPAGFGFLSRWHAAVPLAPGWQLADSIGSLADRERTKDVIHDLRVPYRDTRVMFLRRCVQTERLLELWKGEEAGGDARLAFLRALYRASCETRLLEQALPMQWTGEK